MLFVCRMGIFVARIVDFVWRKTRFAARIMVPENRKEGTGLADAFRAIHGRKNVGSPFDPFDLLAANHYNTDSQNALRYWPYASRELPLLGGDFGLILLFPSSARPLADVPGYTKSGLQVSHAQKIR